jgi:hypothetical protein
VTWLAPRRGHRILNAAILSYIAWNAVGVEDSVGAVGLISLVVVTFIIVAKFILPTIDDIVIKRAKRRRETRVKDDRHR